MLASAAVSIEIRPPHAPGAACALVAEQSSFPDVTEWADYFLHARASDAQALAIMAPRDGRVSS